MARARRAFPARPQRGFGLVELMVAVALSMLLVIAASSLYLSSRDTFVAGDQINTLQEQGRRALELIGQDLRQAGFRHALLRGGAVAASTPNERADIGPALIGCRKNFERASISGNVRLPFVPACVAVSQPDDPDALFLQHQAGELRFLGGSERLYADPSTGTSSNCQGNTPLFVDVDALGKATPDPGSSHGAASVPLIVNVYFLNDARYEVDGAVRTTRQLSCITVGESGRFSTAQPLVSGVWDLHVEYGLDTDRDEVADRFGSVESVAAADWMNVVSVRVCLLMRSDAPSTAAAVTGYVDCRGVTHPATSGSRWYWKTFSATYGLRNRVHGDPA